MKGQIVTLTTLVILTAASKSSNERRSESSNKKGDSGRQEEFRKMKTVPLSKQYQETSHCQARSLIEPDRLIYLYRPRKMVRLFSHIYK
jgi:hypothetical protein